MGALAGVCCSPQDLAGRGRAKGRRRMGRPRHFPLYAVGKAGPCAWPGAGYPRLAAGRPRHSLLPLLHVSMEVDQAGLSPIHGPWRSPLLPLEGMRKHGGGQGYFSRGQYSGPIYSPSRGRSPRHYSPWGHAFPAGRPLPSYSPSKRCMGGLRLPPPPRRLRPGPMRKRPAGPGSPKPAERCRATAQAVKVPGRRVGPRMVKGSHRQGRQSGQGGQGPAGADRRQGTGRSPGPGPCAPGPGPPACPPGPDTRAGASRRP